ncbi:MAG: DUF1934 domain-containing protein [Lachnospiraceae bacterium]|nr:DUF1934 domain-containing protein [Lachnospiraceae bacterium]
MTKDVLITVTGRQFDVNDEATEIITPGTYYLKNGKHYVLYDEQPDDSGDVIKNRVKFHDGHFEMVKNGAVSSALKFNIDEKSESVYRTTAGTVMMEVHTHDISILENDDAIRTTVKYSLTINGQFISECEVNFVIESR